MANKNRGKRGIGMKKIKKRKRYRLKRPAVVVSGVICAVCAVAFAGKAVSGVAEQKKQAQAAYYEAYYEEEADDRPLVCIDAGHGGSVTVEQIMQALMKKMKHCLLPDW